VILLSVGKFTPSGRSSSHNHSLGEEKTCSSGFVIHPAAGLSLPEQTREMAPQHKTRSSAVSLRWLAS